MLYPGPSVKIHGQTAFPNHNRYDETNDQHRQDPRPRNPRLPWQPHARSRSHACRWQLRSRDGAFRSFHRFEGGGRTARWRQDPLPGQGRAEGRGECRSEEHTSELQSLMRISYAVFCLKKKTTLNTNNKNSYSLMN